MQVVSIKQGSLTSLHLAHFLSGQILWTFCRPANLRKSEVFRRSLFILRGKWQGRKCSLLFGLCFLSLAKNYNLMGLINDSHRDIVQQFRLNELNASFAFQSSKIFNSCKVSTSPVYLWESIILIKTCFEQNTLYCLQPSGECHPQKNTMCNFIENI